MVSITLPPGSEHFLLIKSLSDNDPGIFGENLKLWSKNRAFNKVLFSGNQEPEPSGF